MINPSEITEGGNTYELGKFNGKEIVYNFDKMLSYLEVKGRLLFGSHFKIYTEDREVLHKLCSYMIRDQKYCKHYHFNPDKGLLLSGPVGCGKTSLMKLLPYLVPHQRRYQVIPCRNIVFGFNHIGYKTVEDYGSDAYICFDDIGIEPTGRFFGKDCNVIGEILLSRYELLLSSHTRTHGTTNLNAEELEERYGNRVRSRMRQLFNLVAFKDTTTDKRK